MAKEKTYSEKLRDPRWQKKRLEVFKRDRYKCRFCGDKKTELQVHHLKYTGEPWEAPLEDLKTLCKHCHKLMSDYNKGTFDNITSAIKDCNTALVSWVMRQDDGMILMIGHLKNDEYDVLAFHKNNPFVKQIIKFLRNG